jgi:cob(I)alamin adenosyltransferase
VLHALATRPERQHVVVTGRGAPDALVEAADTVTEMRVVKHAYQAGIRAQKGVEL